jgi:hypothetical protein
MSKRGERQSGLTAPDSIVKRMVGQAAERQEAEVAKAEGKDGRGKPGHAGQVGRDNKGVEKKTYYIPLDRQQLIEEIAATEEVSQSNIVEAAILAFYNAYKAGKVDLYKFKEIHGQSLKVAYRLELPDDFNLF